MSRILRTDAAFKSKERKANHEKYNTLRPKAVLKALDDAIKEHMEGFNWWKGVCMFISIAQGSNEGIDLSNVLLMVTGKECGDSV